MSTPITDISGIGPATAAVLAEHGFTSAEAIASTDVNALCAVPGFGPIKAKATIAAANEIATAPQAEPDKLHAKKIASKSKTKSKSKSKSTDKPKKKKKKDAKSSKSDKKDKKKKSDKKSKSKAKPKKKAGKGKNKKK